MLQHENCNRAFARSENRKIHMRSHTGDKPFNCKYAQEFNCTKKFSNSSDRAKHEQTHKDYDMNLRANEKFESFLEPEISIEIKDSSKTEEQNSLGLMFNKSLKLLSAAMINLA